MTKPFLRAGLIATWLVTLTPCQSPTAPTMPTPHALAGWQVSRSVPSDSVEPTTYPRFYAVFLAGWRDAATGKDGFVDISSPASAKDPRSMFVRRAVFSPEEREIRVRVECHGAVTGFVNGARVAIDGEATMSVRLRKGRNEFFFIVRNEDDGGRMRVATSTPVADVEHGTAAEVAWSTDAVFHTPESVLLDPKRDCLYVSSFDNTNPGRANPTGYISRLGLDGEIQEHRWISQLRGPCGMALHEGRLFVAVKGHIAEIDVERGEVIHRHPIPGSQFLNDVIATADGTLYVSNSTPNKGKGVVAIYRMKGGQVEPWIHWPDLSRVNGLWVHGDSLLVGNTADSSLKSVDLATRKITHIASLGAGVVDGIRTTHAGDYLVSHWEGPTYLVSRDGAIVMLDDRSLTRDNAADFEWIESDRLLILPTFLSNRVVALRLPERR